MHTHDLVCWLLCTWRAQFCPSAGCSLPAAGEPSVPMGHLRGHTLALPGPVDILRLVSAVSLDTKNNIPKPGFSHGVIRLSHSQPACTGLIYGQETERAPCRVFTPQGQDQA